MVTTPLHGNNWCPLATLRSTVALYGGHPAGNTLASSRSSSCMKTALYRRENCIVLHIFSEKPRIFKQNQVTRTEDT